MPTSTISSTTIHVISPHQDDAAFSLTLTLARLVALKFQVVIVNCFTVSDYNPLGPPLPIDAISKIRHQEDVSFANRLGAQMIDLGLKDGPLRLGLAFEKICVRRGDAALNLFDPAAGKLKQIFLGLPECALTLIPLGIGGHIDHLRVRDEALAAFRGKPIGLYQDLPYASRSANADPEIAGILADLELDCEPLVTRVDDGFEKKLPSISVYASQATEAEFAAIASYAGGERIWITPQGFASLPQLRLLAEP